MSEKSFISFYGLWAIRKRGTLPSDPDYCPDDCPFQYWPQRKVDGFQWCDRQKCALEKG